LTAARRTLGVLRKELAGALVYWSGAGRLFETVAQPSGAIILMYHSVATSDLGDFIDPPNRIAPALFAKQMEFLRDCRRVVPLSQLVAEIVCGQCPPAGTVCITFDDGYLDTLTVAAPLLEQMRLPATVYLATGYVERQQTQWADEVHWQIQRRTKDRLSLAGARPLDLGHPSGRRAAYALLHQRLLISTESERTATLADVAAQLAPGGQQPPTTLSWDDVRRLKSRYPRMEIGGHTRDHIDLDTHRGDTARAELRGCADDLRRELGITCAHFSFPYSRWCLETRNLVRASGWSSAVGMGDACRITAQNDPFAMPRIEAPRSMTELGFKTSGAYPGALAMLGIPCGGSSPDAAHTRPH
jgi:peptidoglycan/xylan/chitin deacetylase (PgdA/CDA1 family)